MKIKLPASDTLAPAGHLNSVYKVLEWHITPILGFFNQNSVAVMVTKFNIVSWL